MHPALRKRPLFYQKTPPIFYFFYKKKPFSIFFYKNSQFSTVLQTTPPFSTFLQKAPLISFPAYGLFCDFQDGGRRHLGFLNWKF